MRHAAAYAEPRRPRWWTTIVVMAASMVMMVLTATLVYLIGALSIYGPAAFSDPQKIESLVQSRLGFLAIVVLPQFSMLIPVIAAAYLSPRPIRQRLSLVRGHWPLWVWIPAALAAPAVGMISGVISSLFLDESENLKQMSEMFRSFGNGGFMFVVAAAIGFTPAICEELLFRGYIQTRLVRSFPPIFGVFASSALFAGFHLDPVHVVTVFPLGVYLGVICYRSGSIVPAMLAHFVNNAFAVILTVVGPPDADTLDVPGAMATLAIMGVGGLSLLTTLAAVFVYGSPPTESTSMVDAGSPEVPSNDASIAASNDASIAAASNGDRSAYH